MFTHCFSLCSCQRTVEEGTLLDFETLILTVEAGQRVFCGNHVTANLADLSSALQKFFAARHNPKLVKGAAQSDGE